MAQGNFVSNQGTQTPIAIDTVGGGTVMAITKVDISPLGTSGTIWNGYVGITGGTFNAGTFSDTILGGTLNNLQSGTINSATAVLNSGTINVATVSMTSGTINVLPNVNMATGTLNVSTISTLPNIPGGTINVGTFAMTSGTLNVATISTLPNIPGGTLGILTNGTLNSSGTTTGVGTVSNLGSVTNVGQLYNAGTVQTILAGTITNLTSGTINSATAVLNSGTINVGTVVNNGGTIGILQDGTVRNLISGTINSATVVLNSGTINVGTVVNNGGSVQIYQGTIQQNFVPVAAGTSFTTVGTTGVAVWGTIIGASGAGTKQYVSGVDVVVTSGTVDVAITNIGIGGSTGAGVLVRGQFTPGGGISKNFNPAQASGTNGTISYWLGGAGTVAMTVQYWNGV